MRAGQMRHQIKIETKSQAKDGQGGFTTTWNTFLEVKAAIWPVSGNEIVKNNQLTGEITHRIRIRYASGITPAMRINNDGTIYRITSAPINIDMRYRYLELLCKEEM